MSTTALLGEAIEAVIMASRVARAVQADLDAVREITKDDRSPVTVADFAVQAIVAMELQRQFRSPLIVGEEHAGALRKDDQKEVRMAVVKAVQSELPSVSEDEVLDAIDACDHDGSADAYWTLDPVDGTKGFLRGQQYAIALAHIEKGEVTLGVMGCPNLPSDHSRPLDVADSIGTAYAATKGCGAWEYDTSNPNGDTRPITAPTYENGSPIRTCESVEKSHSKHDDTARILEHLGVQSDPVRLDSQCKYAVVARNQADAYLRLPTRADYREKIWDHAAGMLIATEAGAVVSDITGRALDFTHGQRLEENRGVICAAADLHPQIIEAIDALGIAAATAG